MEMKRLAGRLVGQSDGDVGGGGKHWEELDWCTSCRLTDIQHAQKGTSFKRGMKRLGGNDLLQVGLRCMLLHLGASVI